MKDLPKPLRDVVQRLAGLPGMGPKSALRAGLTMLKWPRERAEGLGQAIIDMRRSMCFCSRCHALSESDPCPICDDPSRDATRLCLVGEWDSLIAMEQAAMYSGLYMVLGGLIAPLDGVRQENLEIDTLKRRLAEDTVEELILALGATMEAEATASYIKNMVERKYPGVAVTRLAQGIPLGAEVKHVDKETLRQSLLHRQKI